MNSGSLTVSWTMAIFALLAEYAIDHTQIYEWMRQGMINAPVAKRSAVRHLHKHTAWWAAAAIVMVAAMGLFWGRQHVGGSPAIGRVTHVVGQVHVELDGQRHDLDGEHELSSGTRIQVGGLAGLCAPASG